MAHCAGGARLAGVVIGAALIAGLCVAEPRAIGFPDVGTTPEAQARYRGRILQGEAVIAHIAVHGAEDSALLDPRTIEATWNGEPCVTQLFYRRSEMAFIAVLPPREALVPGASGTITVRAATLCEEPVQFAGSLELHFPAVKPEWETAPQRIRMVNADGKPVPGALLVGNRARYQFTRAGEDGVANLGAPTRTVLTPHLAFAPGYWSTAFDPSRMTSDSVVLQRVDPGAEFPAEIVWASVPLRDGSEGGTARVVTVESALGAREDGHSLIEVDGRYWVVNPPAGTALPMRPKEPGADSMLVRLAKGGAAERVVVGE